MSTKIQLSFGVRQYAIADGCTFEEVEDGGILALGDKVAQEVVENISMAIEGQELGSLCRVFHLWGTVLIKSGHHARLTRPAVARNQRVLVFQILFLHFRASNFLEDHTFVPWGPLFRWAWVY